MGPSFDVANMTLEQAADLVAMRARLGCPSIEKQAISNPALGAMLGGGFGGGASLLNSLSDKSRRRRWLRDALLSSLMGAGVGAAGGYGFDVAKDIHQSARDSGAAEKPAPAAKPKDPILKLVEKAKAYFEQPEPSPGQPASSSPTKPGALDAYTNNPTTAVVGAAGGGALGHLRDRAKQPSLRTMKDLTSADYTKMAPGAAKDIQAFTDMYPDNFNTIPKKEVKEWRRQTAKVRPRRAGKGIGGLLGVLATPLITPAMNAAYDIAPHMPQALRDTASNYVNKTTDFLENSPPISPMIGR